MAGLQRLSLLQGKSPWWMGAGILAKSAVVAWLDILWVAMSMICPPSPLSSRMKASRYSTGFGNLCRPFLHFLKCRWSRSQCMIDLISTTRNYLFCCSPGRAFTWSKQRCKGKAEATLMAFQFLPQFNLRLEFFLDNALVLSKVLKFTFIQCVLFEHIVCWGFFKSFYGKYSRHSYICLAICRQLNLAGMLWCSCLDWSLAWHENWCAILIRVAYRVAWSASCHLL